MKPHSSIYRTAFTLVEMAIVLVIIGLIIGGVLVGQSLIRSATLRGVTADFTRYQAAINTFRVKYGYLPGDMSNATQYWGRNSNASSDNALSWDVGTITAWAAAPAETGTNNGNGSGTWDDWTGSEQLLAWQHMSNAGLVTGKYKGGTWNGTGAVIPLPGIHLPPSKIPFGPITMYGWGVHGMVFAIAPQSPSSYYAPLTDGDLAGNTLVLGEMNDVGYTLGGVYAEDAFDIDDKIDDGLPSSGSMISSTAGNCSSSTTAPGTYMVKDHNEANCTIFMRKAF